MFCLYLINFVRSWTNYAQKIRLVIYNQTVWLVIFLPTFNTPCMHLKINVMEREWKNLEFEDDLNRALVRNGNTYCWRCAVGWAGHLSAAGAGTYSKLVTVGRDFTLIYLSYLVYMYIGQIIWIELMI